MKNALALVCCLMGTVSVADTSVVDAFGAWNPPLNPFMASVQWCLVTLVARQVIQLTPK